MTTRFFKNLIEDMAKSLDSIDKFKPETKRLNLDAVLNLSTVDFKRWYTDRKKVTEKMLVNHELFASIPQMGEHAIKNDWFMDSWTHVKDHLERTKEGLEYLKEIREMYEKKYAPKIKVF